MITSETMVISLFFVFSFLFVSELSEEQGHVPQEGRHRNSRQEPDGVLSRLPQQPCYRKQKHYSLQRRFGHLFEDEDLLMAVSLKPNLQSHHQ